MSIEDCRIDEGGSRSSANLQSKIFNISLLYEKLRTSFFV
jgi:hypothetical protein